MAAFEAVPCRSAAQAQAPPGTWARADAGGAVPNPQPPADPLLHCAREVSLIALLGCQQVESRALDFGPGPTHDRKVRSKPRWPLSLVKTLVTEGRVLLTRRATAWFPTQSEALMVVTEVLAGLTSADFARTAVLAHHLADVYGVMLEGRGWYLKISVDEDAEGRAVVVVSFHPLEETLRTRGGPVIP